MPKFWKQGEQAQRSSVTTPDTSHSFSKSQAIKTDRKPACWGGSRASGEPEVICTPSADKIKAVRQDCSPQPESPATAKKSAYSWNPFAKEKALPAAGAPAMQQETAPAPVKGTYFSSFPILGGQPAAPGPKQPVTKEQTQVSTGDQISNFAGRMGNIVVRSMAGGFGATIGSRAAHSLFNGMTRQR